MAEEVGYSNRTQTVLSLESVQRKDAGSSMLGIVLIFFFLSRAGKSRFQAALGLGTRHTFRLGLVTKPPVPGLKYPRSPIAALLIAPGIIPVSF
jgi:hypothetical protein